MFSAARWEPGEREGNGKKADWVYRSFKLGCNQQYGCWQTLVSTADQMHTYMNSFHNNLQLQSSWRRHRLEGHIVNLTSSRWLNWNKCSFEAVLGMSWTLLICTNKSAKAGFSVSLHKTSKWRLSIMKKPPNPTIRSVPVFTTLGMLKAQGKNVQLFYFFQEANAYFSNHILLWLQTQK